MNSITMPENESNQTQTPQGSGQNPPAGTDGQQAPPAAPQTPATPAHPDVEKLIQSATDRVRTEYSKQFKEQQKVIDELRQSTMTEAQIRKLKETQLGEREAMLQKKELELLAVDVLKENDLPLNLREFVVGKDADETKARATALKNEFQKAVEAAVQERFKQSGRDPKKSETPAGTKRTYTRAEAEAEARRIQSPNVPQKERETVMADLTAAMREGRIKN